MSEIKLENCPRCGARGVSRFKDETRCAKGHMYNTQDETPPHENEASSVSEEYLENAGYVKSKNDSEVMLKKKSTYLDPAVAVPQPEEDDCDEEEVEYDKKFARFIVMCKKQSDEGMEGIIIDNPKLLGDTYVEVIKSLNVLKENNLALHLNK